MLKQSCSCIYNSKNPRCAIYEIISQPNLEDILINKTINKTPFPVCHQNSIKITQAAIKIQENCNNCQLCQIACHQRIIPNLDYSILEKSIGNNLNRINILLSSISKNIIVASEVKSKGNYRNKRIDLLIKNRETVLLLKVLEHQDKYNYYSRSYHEIITEYQLKYPNILFIFKALIPTSNIIKAQNNKLDFITLEEIVDYITGVRNGSFTK